jgi:microcystin-dependent protein
MALDFPANPVDGEVFDGYTWSSSKGVWLSIKQQQPIAITSPTLPVNPKNGDLWLNTSNGLVFAYYHDGTSGQWIEVLASSLPPATQVMFVGTIAQTAKPTPPNGWLFCEGQAISRTEYVRLFNVIGTSYGSGDGSTTFNVPNISGRLVVGKNSGTFNTLGSTGGTEEVTLTSAQTGLIAHSHPNTLSDPGHFHNTSHSHTVSDHAHGQLVTHDGAGGSAIRRDYKSDGSSFSYPQGAGTFGSGTLTTSTPNPQSNTKTTGISISNANNTAFNASSSHSNIQPYIVLNYMIKV